MGWGKMGMFLCGTLFGSAGVRVLTSKDAKNVYTHGVAAVLRARDVVMEQATLLQENCEDIYEGAKEINKKLVEAEIIEDESKEEAKEEESAKEAD